MTNQAFIIQAGTPEWEAAWSLLSTAIISDGLGDGTDLAQASECGETWQYMGSSSEGDALTHSFRHRAHPADGLRKTLELS